MKKSIIAILLTSLIFAGCNSDKKSESQDSSMPDTTSLNTNEQNIVGNDADEHGCKASAGYTWSVLKNECVRIFESGSPFKADGINKDSTLAAYIIMNEKKDSAEIFLPAIKPFIALPGNSAKSILFENKNNGVVVNYDKMKLNILKDNEIIFSQLKSEGIGKILDLK